MTFYDFYDALDNELNEVIAENPQDVRLHKGDDATRKAYAFMIWFLKFYGKRPIYNLNITDGDGDTSCDIIFSTFDNVGKKIFYIIQAKWNTRKNCIETLDSKSFKSTLDDFKLVYSGQKQFSSKNENFNKQYEALKQHLAENQYVKFVYLTLCQTNPSVSENVELFKKQYADLEIIDIERLRRDFIETRYKQFKPENPLEYDYNPEIEVITLPIEQLEIEKNFLQVDAPFLSYTFLVRPKTIHDLFEKYGFKLFFWNIRNPLIASNYNHQIEQSLKDSSSFFWYYNNGITAITQRLPKRINATAQKIEITALQIINGAQTVYSIYQAYRNARNGEINAINDNGLISFRLIQGIGNRAFELNVTRYNNQQNPTEPRDFWANDPVQVRLQNESFMTNYWYEIRRGEFRIEPPNVTIVSNEEFIRTYCQFMGYTNQFYWSIDSLWVSTKNNIDNLLKENQKGEYENYFNDSLRFSDLLVAYRVQELISAISSKLRLLFIRTSTGVFRPERLSSIIRIVLSKIFDKNFNQQVLNKINQDSNFFHKIIVYLHKAEKEFVQNNKKTDFKTFYDYIEKSAIIEQQEIEQIDWETYFNNDSSISKTLELIKLSQMMQESQFNRDSSEPEP